MCGITGFWSPHPQMRADEMHAAAQRMSDVLAHRGPDGSGVWVDPVRGLAIASRRLAVIDLSAAGRQPMHSTDSRYVLVYNGEIYNAPELKKELERMGHRFRGHSDTEVMLAAFDRWGVERSAKEFNGMFAFAVWDRSASKLHLGRDRLGEKPLYYGHAGTAFVFGSELKALKAHPCFRSSINRDALVQFFRLNYIPAPLSIYHGICKLPAGTLLTLTSPGDGARPAPFWSLKEISARGVHHRDSSSDHETVENVESLLRDAVRMRMIADVPLGAFLSGGIDSSLIVALMQDQSARPVRTFTIGFNEDDHNEAHHAAAVAKHLGTDHTELCVTPADALAVIPNLPAIYDEPFADSSQIPTFLVAQLARRQVTVALSGDGGDELFGGYDRYTLGSGIWRKIGWMPAHLRRAASRVLAGISPRAWDQILNATRPLVPGSLRRRARGDTVHTLARMLKARDAESLYLDLVSIWKEPASLVLGGVDSMTTLTNREECAELPDFTRRMMYLDSVTYLPDDILVKVDRATMAVSLEGRVPLLDHRVVERVWALPLRMRIRGGQGKWLLRQILYKLVPRGLIERPKMGFGVPIKDWLRGPLKEWAENLLDESRLRQQGLLDPQPVRQKWLEHTAGSHDWHYYLWPVLMFQAWLDSLP